MDAKHAFQPDRWAAVACFGTERRDFYAQCRPQHQRFHGLQEFSRRVGVRWCSKPDCASAAMASVYCFMALEFTAYVSSLVNIFSISLKMDHYARARGIVNFGHYPANECYKGYPSAVKRHPKHKER